MRYDWSYQMTDRYEVVLSAREADRLARLMPKTQRALKRKLEKYRDIQESGEATSRQQTVLCEAEDELEIVEQFIHFGLIEKVNGNTSLSDSGDDIEDLMPDRKEDEDV